MGKFRCSFRFMTQIPNSTYNFQRFHNKANNIAQKTTKKTQQKAALITVDGKFSGCFLLPKHINRSHKSFIMNWTIREKRKTMAKTIEWNWCVPRENFTISIHAINGWSVRVCVCEWKRGWISMRYRTSIAAVSRHSFSQRECTSKIYIYSNEQNQRPKPESEGNKKFTESKLKRNETWKMREMLWKSQPNYPESTHNKIIKKYLVCHVVDYDMPFAFAGIRCVLWWSSLWWCRVAAKNMCDVAGTCLQPLRM